jgi:hypothetical protein
MHPKHYLAARRKPDMELESDESDCNCKVGRVADAYDLTQLDAELEQRYVAEDASLRDLSEYINTQVIGAVLENSGADIVGDPESIYQTLNDDEVSPERRANVRDQLAYSGVDVESTTSDFVSHQTVRDHLRDCLDIDTGRSGVDTTKEARDVINWARERDEEIIDRVFKRLNQKGILNIGDLEVSHTVRIACVECGKTYRPDDILSEGACECFDLE